MNANTATIEATIGKARFSFSSTRDAVAFALEYERALMGQVPATPETIAAPEPQTHAQGQRDKKHSARTVTPTTAPERTVGGGDALRILLAEVARAAEIGILQSKLVETHFPGKRHEASNALKRLERMCKAFGMMDNDVLTKANEGRSQRLRPGPRFAEFQARVTKRPQIPPSSDEFGFAFEEGGHV